MVGRPSLHLVIAELASHGGELSGNEKNVNKDRVAVSFGKRVFAVVQRLSPLLGHYLGPTFAAFRVSAIHPLDTNWSWIGCLNVT